MSSLKATCPKCGAEFLQATADRTGGFCMKCYQQPAEQSIRRQSPARFWNVILAEIKTRDDLLLRAGAEMLGISRQLLPVPVQRWQAACSLMLRLHSGWANVAWQYFDDLVAGVAGFEECGFEIGAAAGREVMQVFQDYGLDPDAPDLEQDSARMDESSRAAFAGAVREIDNRVMRDTWRSFEQLEQNLITRAQELAAS